MATNTKKILAVMKINNPEIAHDDFKVKYDDLIARIKQMNEEILLHEKKSPERVQLGKDLQVLYKKVAKLKETLNFKQQLTGEQITQEFRSICSQFLPKKLYGSIIDQVNKKLKDPLFVPHMIQVLNDDELEMIESSKKNAEEVATLKKKILDCKKLIQELTPNLLGELSTEEYDKRTAIIRTLSKINNSLK